MPAIWIPSVVWKKGRETAVLYASTDIADRMANKGKPSPKPRASLAPVKAKRKGHAKKVLANLSGAT